MRYDARMPESSKNRRLGSIAAATLSLGAITAPASAQQSPAPDASSQNTTAQPTGPGGCEEVVVVGGVVLAAGALALKRSKKGTQDQLLQDDQDARWNTRWGRGQK